MRRRAPASWAWWRTHTASRWRSRPPCSTTCRSGTRWASAVPGSWCARAAIPHRWSDPCARRSSPWTPQCLWLQVDSLRQGVEGELRPLRLGAVLIGVLGSLALLVAAIGLYSLVAHGVASRARELAVHVALGARRGTVVGLVLRGGLGLAALGLALGVLLSLAAGPRLGAMLFQTSPRDPLVYLAVVAGLLAAAAAACRRRGARCASTRPARSATSEARFSGPDLASDADLLEHPLDRRGALHDVEVTEGTPWSSSSCALLHGPLDADVDDVLGLAARTSSESSGGISTKKVRGMW